MLRKKGSLSFALCARCESRWRDAKTATGFLIPACLATGIAWATAFFNGAWLVGVIVLLVAGAALYWVNARLVRGRNLTVRRMTPEAIVLCGVHPEAARTAAE
jgi:hypothetical protein